MFEMLTSGPEYFPGWVSIVFSLGLALGIVHHAPCLIAGHGNRWFHAGHTAMAVSMIYMYLSMSYGWNWLPAAWQMWFFVATSAATSAFLMTAAIRRQPVNTLWVLLLIQHTAMIYMWFPMMRWNGLVIFVLVSWFAIEMFGWAVNLLPDDVRIEEERTWLPYLMFMRSDEATPAARQRAAVAIDAGSGVTQSRDAAALIDGDCDRHVRGQLVSSGWMDRALMAIMSLSMGYMFYGMQLMR